MLLHATETGFNSGHMDHLDQKCDLLLLLLLLLLLFNNYRDLGSTFRSHLNSIIKRKNQFVNADIQIG